MAVTTPRILTPASGDIIPLATDYMIRVELDPFSGAGAAQAIQVQIASDAGFVTIVWGSGLRWPESPLVGVDHMEISVADALLESGQPYWIRALRQSTTPELSAFSASVDVVAELAVTLPDWTVAQ